MPKPIRIADLIVTTVVLGACAVSCKGTGAGQVAAENSAGSSPAVASAAPAAKPNAAGDKALVGTPAGNTAEGHLVGQGQTCEDGKCPDKLECVKYYGFAGASGPLFTSCEIKCTSADKGASCPKGQSCVTISDGPGTVCRPTSG